MMRTRLQSQMDFTVQVRSTEDDRVVGTGVVISADGKILTCAHVVRDATGNNLQDCGGQQVSIYFPKTRRTQERLCLAEVVACFAHSDDDIVLLQIAEPDLPLLSPRQIACLGCAESSAGNEFSSYGFRQLDNSPSGYAEGRIMGPVMPFKDKMLLTNPIELRTRDVRPGMSGGGVLDRERNLVVGLVTRRWNPEESSINDNIAWATDAFVLTFEPILLKALLDDEL